MRKNKELERRRTDGEGGSIPCPKLPPKTEGPGKQRDKREEKGVVAFTYMRCAGLSAAVQGAMPSVLPRVYIRTFPKVPSRVPELTGSHEP